jgi:hypothetical protein
MRMMENASANRQHVRSNAETIEEYDDETCIKTDSNDETIF